MRGEMVADRLLAAAGRRARRAPRPALVIVSEVVKVFEAMRKSVRSASRPASVSARCAPSTLETKCTRGPPPR